MAKSRHQADSYHHQRLRSLDSGSQELLEDSVQTHHQGGVVARTLLDQRPRRTARVTEHERDLGHHRGARRALLRSLLTNLSRLRP